MSEESKTPPSPADITEIPTHSACHGVLIREVKVEDRTLLICSLCGQSNGYVGKDGKAVVIPK